MSTDLKKYLRKKMGRIKFLLLDEIPYIRASKRIPEIRSRLANFLDRLEPVQVAKEEKVEIHMLCGHRDADMGIWSSWSLMRFIGKFSKLIIHDDGTLSDDDIDRWRKIIPNLEVVSKVEADLIVGEIIKERCPLLYAWRSVYKTSPQLIDAHYFGNSNNIIIMDSDVLVFQYPSRLVEVINSGSMEFAWCQDIRESYSAPSDLIKEVSGVSMPIKFNCGFIFSRRLTIEDYAWLEDIIQKFKTDGRIDINRFWACQTYYAMIASKSKKLEMLPRDYDTYSGKTFRTSVVRHYVGIKKIRFRYFEEGVTRILEQSEIY